MKVVSVVITAAPSKKTKAAPAGKRVALFPLQTVKEHLKFSSDNLIDLDLEAMKKDLKKINQNTTYSFAANGSTVNAAMGDVANKGKMKVAWISVDSIDLHTVQVYEYKGKLYCLDKDFERFYEE